MHTAYYGDLMKLNRQRLKKMILREMTRLQRLEKDFPGGPPIDRDVGAFDIGDVTRQPLDNLDDLDDYAEELKASRFERSRALDKNLDNFGREPLSTDLPSDIDSVNDLSPIDDDEYPHEDLNQIVFEKRVVEMVRKAVLRELKVVRR